MAEAQAVKKHGDEYDVTCDCGKTKRLTAGGSAWRHGCESPVPGDVVEVMLKIDQDGHMTQTVDS